MGGVGSTPIHKAAKDGNLSELYVAVQHHASRINEQEKELGYSALHIAAWQGFDAITRELLKRGALPDLLDKEGRTALHLAALRGHKAVVEALLRGNAQRHIRDKLNHTAYDYAVRKYPDVASMIGMPPPLPENESLQPTTSAGSSSAPGTPPRGGQQPAGQHSGQASPAAGITPTSSDNYAQYQQQPQRTTRPVYPSVPTAGGVTPPTYMDYIQGQPYGAQQQQQQQQQHLPQQQHQPQQPVDTTLSPAQQRQAFEAQMAEARAHAAQAPHINAAVAAAAAHPLPGSGGGYPQVSPIGATFGHGPASHPPADLKGDDWAPAPAGEWGGDDEASAPTAPPQQPDGRTQQNRPPNLFNNLRSAADLAMQQLARLGIKPREQADGHGNAAAAAQYQQQLLQQQTAQQGGAASMLGGASGAGYSGPLGRIYRYNDLAKATGYFAEANKIGEGGFGSVYKGVLDGIEVAIKAMSSASDAMQGQKEFTSEVNILSRLHHPHVVLLIGSCPEKGLLVYELAEGGSLEERLFRPTAADGERPPLKWQDRVRIAAQVASALLYLHSAPEQIVHMDLKPANILLDRHMDAKLGDVGLARLMIDHVPPAARAAGIVPGSAGAPSSVQDTQLVGTMAYVDPEYMRTGQFSPKSDVYALGMVMLQLLTGQEGGGVVDIVEEAKRNPLQFAYALDRKAGNWPTPEALAFADAALKCVQPRRSDRPDLRTVVLPTLVQLRQRTALYDPVPPPAPAAPSAPPHHHQQQHQAQQLPAAVLKAQEDNDALGSRDMQGVPAMFMCPITQEVMVDPVVAADGYTYEREAIQAWLARAGTSPLTNLPLPHTGTVPNMLLRSAIREWQSQHHQQPAYRT